MREDQPGTHPDEPVPPDEFDGVIFDEHFIREGVYEPPARTREAIARFGNRQTSWRHGGGLDAQPSEPRAKSARTRPPSTWLDRLPMIVTVTVVAVVLILTFR